jgi:ABC-type multidrug transport system permease subunit
MSFLLTCARKDLRRRLADPMALILWLTIPLLVGGLMSVIFGGDNATPTATVLLVDEDDSIVGQFLAGAAQSGNVDFVDVHTVTREEGMARMNAGDATAMVVLPDGFAEALLNSEPTAISLVRNPSQIILPGIIQTALEMFVEVVSYAQRLLAGPLQQIVTATQGASGFLPSDTVALFSGSLNDRLTQLGGWLFPPALDVEFVNTQPAGEGGSGAQSFDIGALFLPSMMFMAVLFIAQGMADDLWDEKEAGTLRRAVALPRSLGLFLAGKLVTAAVIMAAVGIAGLAVLGAMGVVTLARAPGALVWMTFGGTALYCFFLVLQFPASSRRGASVVGNVVLFPLMMMGGAFFPFEAMPPWMRAVGEWTPNGQALARFKELVAGTASVEAMVIAAAAIGIPAAVAFVLSVRFVGGRFASRA